MSLHFQDFRINKNRCVFLRNYRDRLDIIADILKIAMKNPKKTQIMYQANLSYKVLKKYLTEIMDVAFVSYVADERCYVLTEKGRVFLVLYAEYLKANTIIQNKLREVQNKKAILEKIFDNTTWQSFYTPIIK